MEDGKMIKNKEKVVFLIVMAANMTEIGKTIEDKDLALKLI